MEQELIEVGAVAVNVVLCPSQILDEVVVIDDEGIIETVELAEELKPFAVTVQV